MQENSDSQESGVDLEEMLDAAASDMADSIQNTDSPDESIQDDATNVDDNGSGDVDAGAEENSDADVTTDDDSQSQQQEDDTPNNNTDDTVTDDSNAVDDKKEVDDDNADANDQKDKAPEPTPDDYKQLQGEYTRSQQALRKHEQELRELQNQFQQMKLQEQRQAEEQRQQNLKPFHEDHPDHSQFAKKAAQMDFAAQQIRELATDFPGEENADVRDRMAAKYAQRFTDQDWENWKESKAYEQSAAQRSTQQQSASVEQTVESLFAKKEAEQKAAQTVDSVFSDPEFIEAIKLNDGNNEYRMSFERNIQSGMSVELAADIAKKDYKILKLSESQSKLQAKESAINERKRLQRDESVVEVNPKLANNVNPEDRLKSRGVNVGDPGYSDALLDELFTDDEALID